MMVVKTINLRIIFINIFLMLSFPVSAENKVPNNVMFNLLHKNIAESTAKLGKVIELCEKERINSKVKLLNNDLLKRIKAQNADVITALTHINFSNLFQCEKEERVSLAYYLGLLSSVKRQNQLKTKDINEIEDGLVYPSIKQIQLSIKYIQLPAKLKKYIEEVVGKKPFNLIKVLKMNNLLDV